MNLSGDSHVNPLWTPSDSESIQEIVEIEEIEETEGTSNIAESKELTCSKGSSSDEQKKKLYLKCPNKCGIVFFYRHTLKRHLEFDCLQKSRYKCPYCNHCCKLKSYLPRHVKHRHPHRNIYAIDLMRNKPVHISDFNSDPIRIIHNSIVDNENIQSRVSQVRKVVENVIEGEKPFPCPNKCGSAYKNMRSMRAHVEFECGQGPRFVCPYCTTQSKYSRNILTHVKLLHPQKESYAIDVITKKTFGNRKKAAKKNIEAAADSMT